MHLNRLVWAGAILEEDMSASASAMQVEDGPPRVPSFGFSIFLSILLIVGGLVAILLAAETTIAIVIILAWMLMIGGIVQTVHAFKSKGVGMTIWKIVVAIAYILTGLFLRMNLGVGLAALTFALIFFFIIEGLMSLVAFARERKKGGSVWLLFDGMITLLLGVLIWSHWPSRAMWIIGVFVGFNMLMNGTTRLMLTLAVRRALKVAEV
jgi:uncharacterized membrane protein HdeD (DUF308 family)